MNGVGSETNIHGRNDSMGLNNKNSKLSKTLASFNAGTTKPTSFAPSSQHINPAG
jgi:hypothetical protein